MYYDYSKQLTYTDHIPTTYAPYKEFTPPCPWSIIHHTCPSGIAWVKFEDDDKRHLCLVHMIITNAHIGPFSVSALYAHINRAQQPFKSQCGVKIGTVEDISIGGDRPECCLECWVKRV